MALPLRQPWIISSWVFRNTIRAEAAAHLGPTPLGTPCHSLRPIMAMSPNTTRNSEAINADVIRQLVGAPDELKRSYRTAGYDGVIRWSARYVIAVSGRLVVN